MTGPFTIDAVLSALGLAVLAFVWQGALLGLGAAIALGVLRRASPQQRYAVCVLALGFGFAVFVRSFVVALAAPLLPADALSRAIAVHAPSATEPDAVFTVVAWLWVGGVMFFAVRFALQWFAALRFRTLDIDAPPRDALALFESLRLELRVPDAVRLARSGLALSPMVVGWLRPVVLVPASSFASLTPEELRAVLAHELAHIKRLDHWVNAAQAVVETVLFFHPAVWWLSSRARLEREHCCDDAAVRTTGDPAVFASALARLESHRHTHTQAALAANGGPLMTRIQRILGTHTPTAARAPRWRTAAALAAGAVVSIAGIAHAMTSASSPSTDATTELLRHAVETGAMSADNARSLYDVLVFPQSEAAQKLNAELDAIREHIDRALAEGSITPAQADEKRAAIDAGLAQRAETDFAIRVLGHTPERAHEDVLRAQFDAMIARGEMTQEQADERINGLRANRERLRHTHEQLLKARAELDAMVDSGAITKEQMELRLVQQHRNAELRVKFDAISRKLSVAVEAGELSRDEADAKLAEVRASLFGDDTAPNASPAERRINLDGLKAELDAMVEAGGMTREQADAKLRAMLERAGATEELRRVRRVETDR